MMWNFKQYSQNTALETADSCMTYEELEQAGNEVAKLVGRCLVFSLCTNSIGSVIGYTGFIQNKTVPLLLSAHLDKKLLLSLADTYHPAYFWYPNKMDITAAGITGKIVFEKYGYCLLKSDYFNEEQNLYPELALLLTTSGSTGSPRTS